MRLTAGNVDDQQPVEKLVKVFFGKLVGDKRYISRGPFERFLCIHEQPLQLITKLKKGMKNCLMPFLLDHAGQTLSHQGRSMN